MHHNPFHYWGSLFPHAVPLDQQQGKGGIHFCIPDRYVHDGAGDVYGKGIPGSVLRGIGLDPVFFSGFNTAIYAIIPDCVEYGEWKTGLRNDGFQYAFISLGNKMGMALGTSLLAMVLGMCGYVAGGRQNPAVLAVIKHSFTTIPGLFWIITGIVLFFYRLNRRRYNEIMKEMYEGGT